jgi:hypothetical protein
MTAIVFLGPTLGAEDAAAMFPATYLPPASRGDVYAAARSAPAAIGIVDGYFHRTPSVLHKEVLWAMSRGIPVYGAASMGALRAAELERFGMIGVGRVFEGYRDGTLTDDDEVAVVHGPAGAGYVAGSEAMVNIRATLVRARDSGVVEAKAEATLLRLAKATFYPGRTWERLLADARESGVPDDAIRRLEAWLRQGRVDRKRDDAVEMIGRMRDDLATGRAPQPVGWRFNSTSMWEELAESVEQRPVAEAGADQVVEGEVLEELKLAGQRYVRARDLVRELEERHRIRLPGFLSEWIQRSGAHDQLRERAWQKQDLLSRAGLATPSLADAGMTEPELWRWYFQDRLGIEVPVDLEGYAAHHDFAGVDLMRRAVLREFIYLRKTHGPGARTPGP